MCVCKPSSFCGRFKEFFRYHGNISITGNRATAMKLQRKSLRTAFEPTEIYGERRRCTRLMTDFRFRRRGAGNLCSAVHRWTRHTFATCGPWPDEIYSTPVTTTLATAPGWLPARYNPFLFSANGPRVRPMQQRRMSVQWCFTRHMIK
jgi:hypothetical protein